MNDLHKMYQAGNVGIHGEVTTSRSHFRSMIFGIHVNQTLGTEGWLGRAVKQIDPNKENVVTAVWEHHCIGPCCARCSRNYCRKPR